MTIQLPIVQEFRTNVRANHLPASDAGTRAVEPAATLAREPRLVIRPIRPSDTDCLQAAFARLSPTTRYYRFHSPLRQLPDSLARYLTHVDGSDHVALVAFDVSGPVPAGIGVARFVRSAGAPDTAELAITLADHAQGKGLARRVLQPLAALAAERGIRTFTALVLFANTPARRLIARLGGSSRGSHADVISYHLPVGAVLESGPHAAAA